MRSTRDYEILDKGQNKENNRSDYVITGDNKPSKGIYDTAGVRL